MRSRIFNDFAYQLAALVLAVIVVHAVYVALVRPRAEAATAAQQALVASGQAAESERSLWIVVKDYEQETCFILALWAIAILGLKARRAWREHRLLDRPLLQVAPGTSILPEDVRDYLRPLQGLSPVEREALLPRALVAALQRFGSTRDVQDVSTAIRDVCDTESERLEAELATIRYIVWAIPSIGFIGTVRGIGQALGQAHRAVEGDIAGVTASLGVAFNSTFVALVISIVIMFLVHQLQLTQDRLVLDTHAYCDGQLVRNLKVR